MLCIYKKYQPMKTNLISEPEFKSIDNNDRLAAISNFIKVYRTDSGYSQLQLSKQSNLHRNTIINAESAKNITILSLFELLDALDVSPEELFYDIK
jgi:DNA-binding XRE family transcriptional regulator